MAGYDFEMPCYSPLKGYVNLQGGGMVFKREKWAGSAVDVACGQCIGCRIDKSREWAARIVHEAQMHEENCFITLTFRQKANCTPEQLAKGQYEPENGSLRKEDFQKFMKRLRKSISPQKVRYYHCGEYGENTERGHHHAILFGYIPQDLTVFKEMEDGALFLSESVERVWGNGFVTVGEVSFQSAAYVSRYCMKKVTGKLAQDHYLRCDEDGVAYYLEPEYSTMSRKPGIGRSWYEKFKEDVWPSDEVPVPGRGVFKKVPGYYQKCLEEEDPDLLEVIKRRRQEFVKANVDEYGSERLMDKYKVCVAKTKQLKRGMI